MNKADKSRLVGFLLFFLGFGMLFIEQAKWFAGFVIGFGMAEINNAHYYQLKEGDDNKKGKKK